MQPTDIKSALDGIHVRCRLFQISIALTAAIVSIVSASDSYRYEGGDPNGYLMMASIMCWFATAILALIGTLAFYRPEDLAWYLGLFFDALAICASIAAPICANCQQGGWKREHGLFLFISNAAWLNLIPITLSFLRTGLIGWESQRGTRLRAWWKEQQAQSRQRQQERRRILPRRNSDVWTPEEIRKLEKRVEQLETEARAKPFTPSETVARWTTYTGEATLPDYESQADTIPI